MHMINGKYYVGKVTAGLGSGCSVIHADVDADPSMSSMFPMGILGINTGSQFLSLMNSKNLKPSARQSGVISYQLLSSSNNISGVSAVSRAALGAFLVGPIGLAAGLTAKRKELYTVQVVWGNGMSSVIEFDPDGYNVFQSCMSV